MEEKIANEERAQKKDSNISRLRKMRKLNSTMFCCVILVVLAAIISTFFGNYFNAVCNLIWAYIGYKYYTESERNIESMDLLLQQQKLLDRVFSLLKSNKEK